MSDKIVQIVPAAPGWIARYYCRDDDGEVLRGKHGVVRHAEDVACWALLESGRVVPLVVSPCERELQVPDDDRVEILSPKYCSYHTTRPGNGYLNEPEPDAEAIAVAVDAEGDATILWRSRSY